jgi:hypothetical protein
MVSEIICWLANFFVQSRAGRQKCENVWRECYVIQDVQKEVDGKMVGCSMS